MDFAIRPAIRSDADSAAALWSLLQDEHEEMEPRIRRSRSAEKRWRNDFKVWVRSRAHGVFVAEAGEELVGLVTAHPHWPAPVYEQQYEIYVNELVVAPAWRGRGVGRALVEAVRMWAREQDADQIRAGVLNVNTAALKFWRSVGAEGLYTTVTLPADDHQKPNDDPVTANDAGESPQEPGQSLEEPGKSPK